MLSGQQREGWGWGYGRESFLSLVLPAGSPLAVTCVPRRCPAGLAGRTRTWDAGSGVTKGIGVPRWGCLGRGTCLHFCGFHSSTSHPISTGTGLGSRVSLVLRCQDTASSLACSAGESLLSFSAWVLLQEAPDPGQGSSCLDSLDNLDVLRTRHAWHARKRRRLV